MSDALNRLLKYLPRGLNAVQWAHARMTVASVVADAIIHAPSNSIAFASLLAQFLARHRLWGKASIPDLVQLLAPGNNDDFVAATPKNHDAGNGLLRLAWAA